MHGIRTRGGKMESKYEFTEPMAAPLVSVFCSQEEYQSEYISSMQHYLPYFKICLRQWVQWPISSMVKYDSRGVPD